MSWKNSLRKASFRGVQFYVDSADTGFGRRTVLHEYPNRDVPFAEDLGRKARQYTIQAYVLGDNYLTQRDALIQAIENNSTAGTLVHPTLGSILAVPTADCRVTWSEKEGGIEVFNLVFSQAGQNTYPSNAVDTTSQVMTAASNAITSVNNNFATQFSVSNQPAFVFQNAINLGQAIVQALNIANNGDPNLAAVFATVLTSFGLNYAGMVNTPLIMAEQINNLAGQVLGVFTKGATSNANQAYTTFAGLLNFGASLPTIIATTPQMVQQATNQQQLISLVQQAALIQMAVVSTQMTFASYNDAVAVRTQLSTYINDQVYALGNTNQDDLFYALKDLQAAVVADLTARAATLVPLKTIILNEPIPALVLAYRLYQDSTRDLEIDARNTIVNPDFVPAGSPLQVLSA